MDRVGFLGSPRRLQKGGSRPAPGCPGRPTPNALWCADYKGEFVCIGLCFLTVSDFASRYLLVCEALSNTQERYAFPVFERAFEEFGVPDAMRTDNGVPVASAHALYGLSKLAVWWLRLGIRLERSAPGHPEQNGRHERLHLTLKTDATRPAAINVLQQQARFDTFVHRYNHERPHQALEMQTPSSVYSPSPRPYRGLEELDYPFHDWTAVITTCGRICYQRRKINVSQVFAGQTVGVKQVDDHSGSSPLCTTIWATSTMRRAGSNRSTTRSARHCHPCLRNEVLPMSPE